jgi:dipeptidyl-peptidase 4
MCYLRLFAVCIAAVLLGSMPAFGAADGLPYAYLFPAELRDLTERLQREKIEIHELREDIDLDVQVCRIKRVVQNEQAGGRRRAPSVETEPIRQVRRFDAGTIFVKVGPESSDVLRRLLESQGRRQRAWRVMGRLSEGDIYPIARLESYVPVTHGCIRPPAQMRTLDKPITFDIVYGKDRINLGGSPVGGLTWLKDGEHYLHAREGRLYKFHAASGRSELFVDPNALCEGLIRLPSIREKDAKSISRRTSFQMSPDRNAILIDYDNDLYYCTRDGATAVRLTSTPGQEKYCTFDPQGRFVAFVRDHNLYVVDVATQTERALTTDGDGTILNGEASWVYFEEVLNRQWKVFWWSPDSSALAFLRTDDGPVPGFTVVNNVPTEQQVERTAYPRAGDPNPHVRLGIVSVGDGTARWVDLGEYLDGTYLITGADWMPDSERVYFFVQDRAQTWLDISTASRSGGAPTRLLRETTDAWVEPPAKLVFLKDGSFLLSSERTGWKHLYLYDKKAQLKHAVTEGEWEVRELHHVDEDAGWVYLTGTRDSHIAEHLYRVKLGGGEVQRLTEPTGHHEISMAPDGGQYIDRWSNASTPTQVALHTTDGTRIRMLDTNPVYERQEYRLGKYEQFQIETTDGFALEASLLKPPGFDPNQKYPVWFMTYGGPHAPTIRDAWQGGRVHDQMLAQMGMLVFRCDPRSASGKGACSAWSAYRQLGVQELQDVEETITWLKGQSYVDGERIGMSGHSYGGFLTAYVLTHSQHFAGGISGAPVTDWHLYDSIYTERFMDLPQNNPEGFEKTSVVKAAKDLHGRLLLLHGAIDDNVHPENTFKFIDALQKADKTFELMIYPQNRHGIGGTHYHRLTVNFIRSVLQLPEDASINHEQTSK